VEPPVAVENGCFATIWDGFCSFCAVHHDTDEVKERNVIEAKSLFEVEAGCYRHHCMHPCRKYRLQRWGFWRESEPIRRNFARGNTREHNVSQRKHAREKEKKQQFFATKSNLQFPFDVGISFALSSNNAVRTIFHYEM